MDNEFNKRRVYATEGQRNMNMNALHGTSRLVPATTMS